MSQYQLGSNEAFTTLYNRHSSKVFAFIGSRVRDKQKVAEVFQEVFVKMHKSKHLYNQTLPFLPWLFSVSRSVLIDFSRKETRSVVEVIENDLEQVVPPQETVRIGIEDLKPKLEELPTPQRAAIELRYVDEKTFEEIAAVLNTSPLNVRQLISRGLKRLKELVKEGETP